MAMNDEETVRVNILFDPKVAESITGDLTEAGLEVEQELELLAIITGRVSTKTLEALSAIDGVLAVEPDRTVEAITDEPESNPSDDRFPDSPI